MKIIFIRSPYFIEVDETSQAESKVELFIWHKGDTEPVTPTYTLSKKAASVTQTSNVYNISNYVKEYIENITTPFNQTINEQESDWVYVKVKRYYSTAIGGTPTLLDTTTYFALNGYTYYLDQYNYIIENEFVALTNFTQDKKYKFNYNYSYPSLTFFIDYTNDTDVYKARYTNYDTTPVVDDDVFLNGNTETQYLMSIPISKSGIDWENGNKLEVFKNDEIIAVYIFIPECEPKYTPMRVDYINQYGTWDFITFFKARTQNWDVKNKEYQLLPNDIDYNPLRGESKMFNYEAKQSIKINTGWLDETYNIFIKDLMVSETILLDNKPVKLKTMSTDLKTSLQDKMINYQIEFEYNYNQINNVI
jgi:hypothetical protein